MERFSRTRLLIGDPKCHKLRTSAVAIVGLGAVGSYVIEGLARAGVGSLLLVDPDRIEPTNINRQLYAMDSTLGKFKTQVACERVADINPECRVNVKNAFLKSSNIDDLLDPGRIDIIIDAIDTVESKVCLIRWATLKKIPIVSSMGAALRTDPSQIRCDDIAKTRGCPLAKKVRQELRKQEIKSGVMCVYSPETVNSSRSQGCCLTGNATAGRQPIGSLSTVTGIFGLTVAHCALEILCGGWGN